MERHKHRTIMFTQRPTHPHTNIVVALFLEAKNHKQFKCPSVYEWLNKLQCTHAVKHTQQ